MTLNVLTIVLDGEPFIRHHLSQLEKLKCDWHWTIVEGVAKPVGCTDWCRPMTPRLSEDGTTEYLERLKKHPRVTVIQRKEWNGKLEMLNTGVAAMKKAGALLEVDADELWTTAQLERISALFQKYASLGKMYFFCRFFVGPEIITTGADCYGNHKEFEWLRAWRFSPGMVFQKHERPLFNMNVGGLMGRHETKAHGLVFDHMAYVTAEQVAFKEKYYDYPDAVENWRRLQANRVWPVTRLKDYLPWVDEKVGAARLVTLRLPPRTVAPVV